MKRFLIPVTLLLAAIVLPVSANAQSAPTACAGDLCCAQPMVGSTDDNGNQVWTGNGFTVTVNSTKRVSGGASIYLKPGYEYAVYNVTVEDQSAPKVQVFVAAGAAKDSDGYKYSGDIVPNDPQILHPDDLAPGQKVRGNVAFAVPIGADVSIVAVPAQLPVATAC